MQGVHHGVSGQLLTEKLFVFTAAAKSLKSMEALKPKRLDENLEKWDAVTH